MNHRPEITLYATADDRHLPYLLQGLAALDQSGEIRLRVRPRGVRFYDRLAVQGGRIHRVSRPYPWSYRLDIREPASDRLVRAVVDLQDWTHYFSHGDLARCDVLFKRSYSPQIAGSISSRFGIKVIPGGMTHSAKPVKGRFEQAMAMARLAGKVESFITSPRRAGTWIREVISKSNGMDKFCPSASPSFVPNGLKEFAFFQIKCHGDGSWREAEQLNQDRANLIRVMRSKLGERFQGGMYFDGPPRPEFIDCLSNLPNSPEQYLKLVNLAAVVVSTNGFGQSVPWKLCEYLSLGKCIVTESLAFPLPVPLRPGIEVATFRNLSECAAKTIELLKDTAARERMGAAAGEYYRNHVAPAATARRYIATALQTTMHPGAEPR